MLLCKDQYMPVIIRIPNKQFKIQIVFKMLNATHCMQATIASNIKNNNQLLPFFSVFSFVQSQEKCVLHIVCKVRT